MAEREGSRMGSFKNMEGRTYKNGAKTVADARKKRTEVSVELRKRGRDEQLFKKRNIGLDVEEPIADEPSPDDYETILSLLRSQEAQDWLAGARKIRQKLTNAKTTPIKEIIEAGLVPALVRFLSSGFAHVRDPAAAPNSCTLQFEVAWALTNVASGSSEETRAVVQAGALPYFVALLQSNDPAVCEQAVWALGNVAGDGPTLRDDVLRKRALPPLLHLVSPDRSDDFIRNVAWTLSNLCRGKDPPPDFNQIRKCLPVFASLLNHHDCEILGDVCWALSYITDGDNDKIQAVVDQGVVPKLVEILGKEEAALLSPCLRTLGNIVTGTDLQTQSVIDCGGLTKLTPLLKHPKATMQKEAAWMVSNIAAGTQFQIQGILNLRLVPPLIDIIKNGEFKAQKEAAWALSNITSGGSLDQIAAIANVGALEALCGLLSCRDSKTHLVLLDGISNILAAGKKIGQLEQACVQIESCGGLDKIERLQGSPNEQVYRSALDIIESFFSESDDEENVAPAVNANGVFQFNASEGTDVKGEPFEF